jgi:hypothetical protein
VSGSGACAVCGKPEPFGTNLCPQCGASSNPRDALVFLTDTPDGGGPDETESRLVTLTGDAVVGRAARGRQPLLRLPASLTPRVVEQLESKGVGARIVPVARAWTMMPAHFFLMLVAILATGTLAGLGPVPLMLWMSPLLASLLLLVAQHTMVRPALGNARHAPRLPGAAALAVQRAFAEMSDDVPRERLAEVVRVAQPVFVSAPRELGSLLSELVVAASATAIETERQTAMLAVLDDHADTPDLRVAAERCERSRHTGLDLLERAAAALASLGATHPPREPGARHRPLAELVQELEREAEAQAEAARDLETLLRG